MSFGGQFGGNGIEGSFLLPLQQPVHRSFTGIVSGEGQTPVIVMGVQVMEVFGSCLCAGLGFEALVEGKGSKTVAFCSIAPASRTSSNLLRRPFFWPSKPEAR